MSDWPSLHESVVRDFAAAWAEPDPRAFDALLAEDVELVQPLLAACTGKRRWQGELERLLDFVPDLRSTVLSWSGRAEILFIEHRLEATIGSGSVRVPAVDKLWLTEAGLIARRHAYFDPQPFTQRVVQHPGYWLPWWRSGLGPLLGRRRLPGFTR
ncbi:nuclear transport factor 2 family protein [Amycolatopsis jiangsuensis]|uniref:Ketosteroid isomerase-like protein n=1 Tax=Amycolatopsis jiangsuensis TaxID=1181879 RepID=A0A840IX69_9PSEU|nr:nuclear transport factor 2 family protein [Amycolatopsis jiangsuensis]MBB4685748.1 ketosteroid isomerase-like protein [Amycolatopsis jiangsuensis]